MDTAKPADTADSFSKALELFNADTKAASIPAASPASPAPSAATAWFTKDMQDAVEAGAKEREAQLAKSAPAPEAEAPEAGFLRLMRTHGPDTTKWSPEVVNEAKSLSAAYRAKHAAETKTDTIAGGVTESLLGKGASLGMALTGDAFNDYAATLGNLAILDTKAAGKRFDAVGQRISKRAGDIKQAFNDPNSDQRKVYGDGVAGNAAAAVEATVGSSIPGQAASGVGVGTAALLAFGDENSRRAQAAARTHEQALVDYAKRSGVELSNYAGDKADAAGLKAVGIAAKTGFNPDKGDTVGRLFVNAGENHSPAELDEKTVNKERGVRFHIGLKDMLMGAAQVDESGYGSNLGEELRKERYADHNAALAAAIALVNKVNSGAKLTPEEDALYKKLPAGSLAAQSYSGYMQGKLGQGLGTGAHLVTGAVQGATDAVANRVKAGTLSDPTDPHDLDDVRKAAVAYEESERTARTQSPDAEKHGSAAEMAAMMVDPVFAGTGKVLGAAAEGIVGAIAKKAPAALEGNAVAGFLSRQAERAAAVGDGELAGLARGITSNSPSLATTRAVVGTAGKLAASPLANSLDDLARLAEGKSTGYFMDKYGPLAAEKVLEGSGFYALSRAGGADHEEALMMAALPLGSAIFRGGVTNPKALVGGLMELGGDIVRTSRETGIAHPELPVGAPPEIAQAFIGGLNTLDRQNKQRLAHAQNIARNVTDAVIVPVDSKTFNSPEFQARSGARTESGGVVVTEKWSTVDQTTGKELPARERKVIYVDAGRIRETLSHELGHLLGDKLNATPEGQALYGKVLKLFPKADRENILRNNPGFADVHEKQAEYQRLLAEHGADASKWTTEAANAIENAKNEAVTSRAEAEGRINDELVADYFKDVLDRNEGRTSPDSGLLATPRNLIGNLLTGGAAALNNGRSHFATGGTHGNAEVLSTDWANRKLFNEPALEVQNSRRAVEPSPTVDLAKTPLDKSSGAALAREIVLRGEAADPVQLAAAKLVLDNKVNEDNVRSVLGMLKLNADEQAVAEGLWRRLSGVGGENTAEEGLRIKKLQERIAEAKASRSLSMMPTGPIPESLAAAHAEAVRVIGSSDTYATRRENQEALKRAKVAVAQGKDPTPEDLFKLGKSEVLTYELETAKRSAEAKADAKAADTARLKLAEWGADTSKVITEQDILALAPGKTLAYGGKTAKLVYEALGKLRRAEAATNLEANDRAAKLDLYSAVANGKPIPELNPSKPVSDSVKVAYEKAKIRAEAAKVSEAESKEEFDFISRLRQARIAGGELPSPEGLKLSDKALRALKEAGLYRAAADAKAEAERYRQWLISGDARQKEEARQKSEDAFARERAAAKAAREFKAEREAAEAKAATLKDRAFLAELEKAELDKNLPVPAVPEGVSERLIRRQAKLALTREYEADVARKADADALALAAAGDTAAIAKQIKMAAHDLGSAIGGFLSHMFAGESQRDIEAYKTEIAEAVGKDVPIAERRERLLDIHKRITEEVFSGAVDYAKDPAQSPFPMFPQLKDAAGRQLLSQSTAFRTRLEGYASRSAARHILRTLREIARNERDYADFAGTAPKPGAEPAAPKPAEKSVSVTLPPPKPEGDGVSGKPGKSGGPGQLEFDFPGIEAKPEAKPPVEAIEPKPEVAPPVEAIETKPEAKPPVEAIEPAPEAKPVVPEPAPAPEPVRGEAPSSEAEKLAVEIFGGPEGEVKPERYEEMGYTDEYEAAPSATYRSKRTDVEAAELPESIRNKQIPGKIFDITYRTQQWDGSFDKPRNHKVLGVDIVRSSEGTPMLRGVDITEYANSFAALVRDLTRHISQDMSGDYAGQEKAKKATLEMLKQVAGLSDSHGPFEIIRPGEERPASAPGKPAAGTVYLDRDGYVSGVTLHPDAAADVIAKLAEHENSTGHTASGMPLSAFENPKGGTREAGVPFYDGSRGGENVRLRGVSPDTSMLLMAAFGGGTNNREGPSHGSPSEGTKVPSAAGDALMMAALKGSTGNNVPGHTRLGAPDSTDEYIRRSRTWNPKGWNDVGIMYLIGGAEIPSSFKNFDLDTSVPNPKLLDIKPAGEFGGRTGSGIINPAAERNLPRGARYAGEKSKVGKIEQRELDFRPPSPAAIERAAPATPRAPAPITPDRAALMEEFNALSDERGDATNKAQAQRLDNRLAELRKLLEI